jgi:hypothetical protein
MPDSNFSTDPPEAAHLDALGIAFYVMGGLGYLFALFPIFSIIVLTKESTKGLFPQFGLKASIESGTDNSIASR